jgi:hypothetical protein
MKQFRLIFIASILFIFLLSCNVSGTGIYQSIVNEEKILDFSLDNSLTVNGMTLDGTDTNYFVSAGVVFFKDRDSDLNTDWGKVDLQSKGLSQSVILFDSRVFTLLSSIDGSTQRFYEIENAGTATPTLAANPVQVVSPTERIGGIAEAGANIYATVRNGAVFNLHEAGTTLIFSDTTADLAVGTILAAFDGTDYWVTDGYSVYTSSDSYANPVSHSMSGKITGLHFSTAFSNTLFASTSSGKIYSESGGSFSEVESGLSPLYGFSEINRDGTDLLLVGSISGYYESSDGVNFQEPDGTSVSTDGNYQSSILSSADVLQFYIDTVDTPQIIYALTAQLGLWQNDLNTDSNYRWNQM